MTGYELARLWWDFAFENPDKVRPTHAALYFFAIEHCNRLGWKSKFGLPSTMAMEAIGISSYNTYIKSLNDLIEWGFIEMVQKSKNQYSSNIIALSVALSKNNKALDKAITKHVTKQRQSTIQSTVSINKPITYNQETNKQIFIPPDLFEVVAYFLEKGYTEEIARKFFDYYELAGWVDRNNKKIKNWKLKAVGVWFKDENKIVNNRPQYQPPKKMSNLEQLMYNANKAHEEMFGTPLEGASDYYTMQSEGDARGLLNE